MALTARSGEVRVGIDNDEPFGKDCDYSHGTTVEYLDGSGFSFRAKQEIYTPDTLKSDTPVEGDRPFAGVLEFTVSYQWEEHGVFDWISEAGLAAGVLGPSSGAERMQKKVHSAVSAHEPKGWDYQLDDDLILQVLGKRKLVIGDKNDRLGQASGVYAAVEAGTLQTFFGLGSDIVLSTDLSCESTKILYVKAGIEERFWCHNELIEGNASSRNYKTTSKVDMKTATTVFNAGVGLRFERWSAEVLAVMGTKEYDTQGSAPCHASLVVGFAF